MLKKVENVEIWWKSFILIIFSRFQKLYHVSFPKWRDHLVGFQEPRVFENERK